MIQSKKRYRVIFFRDRELAGDVGLSAFSPQGANGRSRRRPKRGTVLILGKEFGCSREGRDRYKAIKCSVNKGDSNVFCGLSDPGMKAMCFV